MEERYEIVRLIGKNTTGGIYEAIDHHHERRVLLHRFYSSKGDTSVRGWDYIFRDIVRQWKLISNPGFIKLHEAGIDEDGAFISMHYFESSPMLVEFNRAMELDEFFNFAEQALKTLIHLHSMGIVHGAVGPDSFLVSLETVNKKQFIIRDLGLYKLTPKINRQFAEEFYPGDFAILAPELFERLEPVDRTDIYMLGQTFYYMIAGAHPLAELSKEEAERRHFQHDFPRLDHIRDTISEELATWIQQMTFPHPDDRFQTMQHCFDMMPKPQSSLIPRPRGSAVMTA